MEKWGQTLALLENAGPARPASRGPRPANKSRAADAAACAPVLSFFFSLTRVVNTQLKMQISHKMEKINETKSQLFERINKINKPLDNIRNERGGHTTDLKDIKDKNRKIMDNSRPTYLLI